MNLRSIDAPWGHDEVFYLDLDDLGYHQGFANCRIGKYNCRYYFKQYESFIKHLGELSWNSVVSVEFDHGLLAVYWFKSGLLHREEMPALIRLYRTGLYCFNWYSMGEFIQMKTSYKNKEKNAENMEIFLEDFHYYA